MKVRINTIVTLVEKGCRVILSEESFSLVLVKMAYLKDTDKVYLVSYGSGYSDAKHKELDLAEFEEFVGKVIELHNDSLELTISC